MVSPDRPEPCHLRTRLPRDHLHLTTPPVCILVIYNVASDLKQNHHCQIQLRREIYRNSVRPLTNQSHLELQQPLVKLVLPFSLSRTIWNASAAVDRALRRSLTPRAARTWSFERAPLDPDPSARIDPLNPEAVRDLERTICLDPAAAELDPTEAVRANHSATRG